MARITSPNLTGYYLCSLKGTASLSADGSSAREITETFSIAAQKNRYSTPFWSEYFYDRTQPIVLTVFTEGFGVESMSMSPASSCQKRTGTSYGISVDGNGHGVSCYNDTTLTYIDPALSELEFTFSSTQQVESSAKPKTWKRTVTIKFIDTRADGPEGVSLELRKDNLQQYQLVGVNSLMEYRRAGTREWKPCTDEPIFFDVPAIDVAYHVRYKATDTQPESKYVSLEIPARRSAPGVTVNWVDETLYLPSDADNMEYALDDGGYQSADSIIENGISEILDAISGTSPVTMKIRYAADGILAPSAVMPIKLYPRRAAPEGIEFDSNTYIATGVAKSMQYFVEGSSSSWRSVSGTSVNLREYARADRDVIVRFRSKSTSTASVSKSVIISLPRLAASPDTLHVDFANQQIVGFQSNRTYQYRTGTGAWKALTLNNGAFSVSGIISTAEDVLLSIRIVGTDTVQASDAWQVNLPKRPASPTTAKFVYNNTAYVGQAVLTGVSPEWEYQVKGETVWTSFDSTQKVFAVPTANATYYIRVKSTSSSFPSTNKTLTLYAPASAPTSSLNMTTEKISISKTMEYRINNGGYTAMPSGETTLLTTDYINALTGTNTCQVTIRYAATETKPASKEKTITLSARRSAPNTVTYSAGTQYISGATTAMQYREVGTTTWKTISKTSFSVATVLNGRTDVVLEFRYKPTTTAVGSYTQRVNCF